MTDGTKTPQPASAATEPVRELAAMSLNEAGYASLPPTGTYSPPTSQQDYHERPTPTNPTFAPGYTPYGDDGSTQYVYYTPTPQMGHPPLAAPFSPGGPDVLGIAYGFEPMMPSEAGMGGMEGGLGIIQPGVAMGPDMPNAFAPLQNSFDSSPPGHMDRTPSGNGNAGGNVNTESWRKGVSNGGGPAGGEADRRGNTGIYQPPHIQRMMEQQQQAQAVAVAATIQHQPTHVGHPVDRMRMMLDNDVRPQYGYQTLAENQLEWWQALPQHQQHTGVGGWGQGLAHGPLIQQQIGNNGSARRGAYGTPSRGGIGGVRRGFGGTWRGSDKRKDVSFLPCSCSLQAWTPLWTPCVGG
jgi:hypothetical protein